MACDGGSDGGAEDPLAGIPQELQLAVADSSQAFGEAITFDLGLVDPPDGVTYAWAFGDGGVSAEASPRHVYTEPGLYNVSLTIAAGRSQRSGRWIVTASDLALAAGAACTGSGARGWCQQFPASDAAPLADADFLDGRRGWAVRGDEVLKSVDGGANWTTLTRSPGARWVDIVAVDESTLWVLAEDGLVLRSVDGGSTWSSSQVPALPADNSTTPHRIGATGAGEAWHVAAGGVHVTRNGGTTWQRVQGPPGTGVRIWSVADTSTLWAAIRSSSPFPGSDLYRTSDGGGTWTQVPSPPIRREASDSSSDQIYTDSLQALGTGVAVVGIEYGFEIAGEGGAGIRRDMLLTADGGATWRLLSTTSYDGFGEYTTGTSFTYGFADAQRGARVGNGVAQSTTDGGVTWNELPLPAQDVSGLDLNGTGRLVALTAYGLQRHFSFDTGVQWLSVQTVGTEPALESVRFFDRRNGLATTDTNLLRRTSDGGRSWTTQRVVEQPSTRITNLRILPDGSLGWAVLSREFREGGSRSETSGILYTTDRGRSWTERPAIDSPVDACFVDDLNGWVGAGGGEAASQIHATRDGGLSWTGAAETDGWYVRSLDFRNPQDGVAGGTDFFYANLQPVLAVTRDGGRSWRRAIHDLPDDGESPSRVRFVDDDIVVATTRDGLILRSTDRGETWRTVYRDVAGVALKDLVFVSSRRGHAVGGSGRILATNNGGATWTVQDSGTTVDLLGVHFRDSATGWIVAADGSVRVTVTGGQ